MPTYYDLPGVFKDQPVIVKISKFSRVEAGKIKTEYSVVSITAEE